MTQTTIEWTDCTWNPVRGCSMAKGSEAGGCLNCYAARMAARNMPGHRSPTTGEPFAVMRGAGPRWTGRVELIPGKLAEPLHWRKPRRCFVNSMSDLFHESLSFEEIAAVFGVMAACPHITFQVLTKRPELARKWFSAFGAGAVPSVHCAGHAASRLGNDALSLVFEAPREELPWPLPNLWLGISAENQETFDARWPHLRECPAAVRFWSYEPALGPVDPGGALEGWDVEPEHGPYCSPETGCVEPCPIPVQVEAPGLDWVIAGGESGPGARPPHPAWFRTVRDQCVASGVPFLFKQWGDWGSWHVAETKVYLVDWSSRGTQHRQNVERGGDRGSNPAFPGYATMYRIGKSKAGRLLDGRTWDEFPEAAP